MVDCYSGYQMKRSFKSTFDDNYEWIIEVYLGAGGSDKMVSRLPNWVDRWKHKELFFQNSKCLAVGHFSITFPCGFSDSLWQSWLGCTMTTVDCYSAQADWAYSLDRLWNCPNDVMTSVVISCFVLLVIIVIVALFSCCCVWLCLRGKKIRRIPTNALPVHHARHERSSAVYTSWRRASSPPKPSANTLRSSYCDFAYGFISFAFQMLAHTIIGMVLPSHSDDVNAPWHRKTLFVSRVYLLSYARNKVSWTFICKNLSTCFFVNPIVVFGSKQLGALTSRGNKCDRGIFQ